MLRAASQRRQASGRDPSTQTSDSIGLGRKKYTHHTPFVKKSLFVFCFIFQKNNWLSMMSSLSSFSLAAIAASFYVLSGVTQPLILNLCKDAGLADSSCQLYMLFYYLGPASVTLSLLNKKDSKTWPARTSSSGINTIIIKTGAIALFDFAAQMLNYTGAVYAGPTIFAIVYSSVTVWTAVFSFLLLKRVMTIFQWIGVIIVFAGLGITGIDSIELGPKVIHGLFLVVLGSMMHALTYVFSEAVMIIGDDDNERISVRQNCAIQGTVATCISLVWQLSYTLPRFQSRIWYPMQTSGTTILFALTILFSFTVANLIHSIGYFYTLKNFPGGATSAGVMKALQAVLVFVATHYMFCGTSSGGQEMCFTYPKLYSLITVVTGVILFGIATERWTKLNKQRQGYAQIDSTVTEVEDESDKGNALNSIFLNNDDKSITDSNRGHDDNYEGGNQNQKEDPLAIPSV